MKTIFPLTLAAIVSTILVTSSTAQAAPKDDSVKTANQATAMKIFMMSLNDTNFEFSMVASVNDGAVTLRGPVPYTGPGSRIGDQKPDQNQRNKIDGQIQALTGVGSVKDELDIDTVPVMVAKK